MYIYPPYPTHFPSHPNSEDCLDSPVTNEEGEDSVVHTTFCSPGSMASVSRSSSTWLLSLRVALISTGVVSMAVVLNQCLPVVSEFAVSGAPVVWRSFCSWLKPPYLYVIINGIIITIAASSKFQQTNRQEQPEKATKDPYDERTEFAYEMKTPPDFASLEMPIPYEAREVTVSEVKTVEDSPAVEDEEELVISRSATPPLPPSALLRRESSEISLEHLSEAKPLVSSRFGHRKPVKASPEGGKALRVSKSKRHETLENTWKMITDGRHMPLTRHLKKSDTWENHGRHIAVTEDTSSQRVNKSETFKDRTDDPPPRLASPSLGSGKLRKEPSLSQDELNRRVEAFIKKFNEDMRLQRQESLNQYNEMISRGAQY